jgi:predicted SAM-dependent methyltransferase
MRKELVRDFLTFLFRIPALGYVFKLIVAVLKSPAIAEAHELQLADIKAALVQDRALLHECARKTDGIEANHVGRHEFELVTQKVGGLEYHLPGLLNHISSFNACARSIRRLTEEIGERLAIAESGLAQLPLLDKQHRGVAAGLAELRAALEQFRKAEGERIGGLGERLEFVRNEMLYEFRYGPALQNKNDNLLEPKIINQEKYESMRDGFRVNLGCGHLAREGYLNVDRRTLPAVDVVAAVDHLPFPEQSISELYSAHLVEHFPEEEFRRRLLPYWHKLIKEGGEFKAIMPDWEMMIRKYTAGEYGFERMRKVTFGAQDYEGDFHYNMFTKDSMARLLAEAGFSRISFPVEGRLNGDCLEFEVHAVK